MCCSPVIHVDRQDPQMFRLCYLPEETDLTIQSKVENVEQLRDYFDIHELPYLFCYIRDGPDDSPRDAPDFDSKSVSSNSHKSKERSRAVQAEFRDAVLQRDNNACVVTGEEHLAAHKNVEAAHIFDSRHKDRLLQAGHGPKSMNQCSEYRKCILIVATNT